MAHELNWSFARNVGYAPSSIADQRNWAAWWIGSFLLGHQTAGGAAWTLYGSSDAVTAGLDATDRLSLHGAYDPSKWVAAGGPHSWFVLKSPPLNGVNFYLTADVVNQSSPYWVTFTFSKGAPTGGTVSAKPTATGTEWDVGSPLSTLVDASTVRSQVRMSGGLSDRGDFWLVVVPSIVGQAVSALLVMAPDGVHPSDPYPIFTEGSFAGRSPQLVGGTGNNCLTRGWNGAQAYSMVVSPIQMMSGDYPDSFTGKYLSLPAHVWVSASSNTPGCYRGRLMDVAAMPYYGSSRTEGLTLREGGVVKYVMLGGFQLPFDTDIDMS